MSLFHRVEQKEEPPIVSDDEEPEDKKKDEHIKVVEILQCDKRGKNIS